MRTNEFFHVWLPFFVGLGITTAIFVTSKDHLIGLFNDDKLHGLLSIALLLVSALWFYRYLMAALEEFSVLSLEFDVEEIFTASPLIIVVGLAVLFGLLMGYSSDILIYACVGVILSILDLMGSNIVLTKLALLWEQKLFTSAPSKRARVMFDYYHTHLNFFRLGIMVLIFCSSVGIAVASRFTHDKNLMYVAYGMLIGASIISEVILDLWRRERRHSLKFIQAEGDVKQATK